MSQPAAFPTAQARVGLAGEARWRILADAGTVLGAALRTVPQENGGEALRGRLQTNLLAHDTLGEGLSLLGGLPDGPDRAREMARLEEQLDAAEWDAVRLSDDIADPHWRAAGLAEVPVEALASFAGLVARHAGRVVARLLRVELVAERLLTISAPGQPLRMRPAAEADGLLRLIAPPRQSPAPSRAPALAFLRAAAHRLETLKRLGDVFDGGFCLDTRGYKLALGDELFDPDILYAVVEFNLAFAGRLKVFQKLEHVSDADLEARQRAVEAQIREVFADPTRAPRARPDFRPPPAAPVPARASVAPSAQAPADRRNFLRLAGGALAVALGAYLGVRAYQRRSKFHDLTAADLADISPLIESGSVSPAPHSIFVGHLSSARWFVLSRSQRLVAARALRVNLWHRDVRAALVYRDDLLAVQIEQGRLLMVE